MAIKRFGVSIDEEVLSTLDRYVRENNFSNRSQAIRSLVEQYIVENKWQKNEIVAGAIVILYDHHKSDIIIRLNEIQHDYHEMILSTQHFHLDHDTCLEIIAVKGRAKLLQELADLILSRKGIIHGKLVMSKAE
ncbi:MAG: nickel-responsive transcriptional regulator NikR [Bacteroidales bacterium]|nr:nickel-responsive transcriptional regulator NikR [Bacteroidales bacterium]